MANLYFATDNTQRDALQRRFRRNEVFRIRKGIYADTDDTGLQNQLLGDRWDKVAAFLFDKPIAVYRTAAELRPAEDRVYLMVAEGTRRPVSVGPLEFIVESGVVDEGIEPFSINLQHSALPRRLLENLTLSRARKAVKKTLGQDWVEAQLVQEVQRRGEDGLNLVRDEAARLAPILGLEKEQRQLNTMIAAILATHPSEGILHSKAGLAQASGMPFDAERVELFQQFFDYLNRLNLETIPYEYDTAGWRALAFFESYFSNYIERTRFTIDEAEEIYAKGAAQYERHEDSHDLLALTELAGDETEMSRTPKSAEELIDILKARHSILLAQRPGKRPGKFKEKPNEAGATLFVAPKLVEGTLAQGISIYKQLPEGILRALFMHFLVAEVHPFVDGNGRMARLMLNAELVAVDQHKIIVPTVCRDNYLAGMRQASRQHKFRAIVKVLHQLQQYTASIGWTVYDDARATLIGHAANQEPDAGLMVFNKELRKYTGDYQAD